jgi:hypothetical protein
LETREAGQSHVESIWAYGPIVLPRGDGGEAATNLLLAPRELDPAAVFRRRWPIGPAVVTRARRRAAAHTRRAPQRRR